ncbi:hypothetical protein ATG_18700 [Desulfurococcaceae archaeon AG1]|nr:hypothetical protein ATG_18700 [Desulfurococcaceae archaeon AG1]
MARRRKGKYKGLAPVDVAARALENLLSAIPVMTRNYAEAMERFRRDVEAQGRYRNNLALWIAIAREELSPAFAAAAAAAKERYYREKAAARAPARAVRAPARAVAAGASE